jgi:hypothetical protein
LRSLCGIHVNETSCSGMSHITLQPAHVTCEWVDCKFRGARGLITSSSAASYLPNIAAFSHSLCMYNASAALFTWRITVPADTSATVMLPLAGGRVLMYKFVWDLRRG